MRAKTGLLAAAIVLVPAVGLLVFLLSANRSDVRGKGETRPKAEGVSGDLEGDGLPPSAPYPECRPCLAWLAEHVAPLKLVNVSEWTRTRFDDKTNVLRAKFRVSYGWPIPEHQVREWGVEGGRIVWTTDLTP